MRNSGGVRNATVLLTEATMIGNNATGTSESGHPGWQCNLNYRNAAITCSLFGSTVLRYAAGDGGAIVVSFTNSGNVSNTVLAVSNTLFEANLALGKHFRFLEAKIKCELTVSIVTLSKVASDSEELLHSTFRTPAMSVEPWSHLSLLSFSVMQQVYDVAQQK
jgi:hypothetical protein